jgi:hypothetical protein
MTADFTSIFNQWCLKALSVWQYRGHRPQQTPLGPIRPDGGLFFFNAFS